MTAAFSSAFSPAFLVSAGTVVSLPLAITVEAVAPRAALALPLGIRVGELGQGALPLRVAAIDAETLAGTIAVGYGGQWGVAVRVAGIDLTANIVGEIAVEAEEGCARVADLTLLLSAGDTLYLPGWSGRSVEIDVGRPGSGGLIGPLRLFTGAVDLPTLNVTDGTLSLRCSDGLQDACAALPAADIAALISGSRFSPAVFDPASAGWSLCQDRLSTVPAALDMDVYRQLRLTNWAAKPAADVVFDADLVGDGSVNVELAERSGIVNAIDVTFDYRFPRLKADGYGITYSLVDLTGFANFVMEGRWFLQREAVVSAISSAGGHLIGDITWVPLPTVSVPLLYPSGVVGSWEPGASDGDLCMGFSATVGFDYEQTITERHKITVQAEASISAIGVLRETMTGALEGVYPEDWETHNALFKAGAPTASAPADMVTGEAGKTVEHDPTLTPDTNRSAADTAMEVLIAVAKTRIQNSHRRNRVSFSIPANPAVDVDKTYEIDVPKVQATGKCVRVRHTLNPEAGQAVSEISLAISACSGVGTTHPDTATVAPAGSEAAVRPLAGAPLVSFNSGAAEDHVVTIEFPGVEAVERQNAVREVVSAYAAPLAEDAFTVLI